MVIAVGLRMDGAKRDIYSLARRLVRPGLLESEPWVRGVVANLEHQLEGIPITKARGMLTKFSKELAGRGSAMPLTRRGVPVMALMTWELYEAVEETLEIMSDPELVAALRQSIEEVGQGRSIPWKSAKAELSL